MARARAITTSKGKLNASAACARWVDPAAVV